MFNRNRPKPPSNIRSGGSIKLPQLWAIPEMEQITSILQTAQKNADTFIEQMWSVEGLDKMFVLNAKVDDEGDPLWILKESRITDTKTLREHRSRDTALIHTLIVSECQGEVSSNSKNTSEFGTSINLSIQSEAEAEAAGDATTQVEGQARRPKDASLKSSANLPMLNNDEAILQGDLTKIQLPMVLQSIQMGKMTGRLAIRTDSKGVDVYFDDGEPVHATDGIDKGDEVILGLVMLHSGKFQFIPDERTVEKTVGQRLDSLLMESISLVDQSNFLDKEGFKDTSFLISKHPSMSEQELQESLAQGLPLEQASMYEFLRNIGAYKQFSEVLNKKPLKRSEWVPLVFNFVTLGIVSIADSPPQEKVEHKIEEQDIDYKSLAASLKPINRPETGVLIYPAFQYFLAQECYRYEMCGIPLTLAVFSVKLLAEDKELTNLDVYAIMELISDMKRPIDILGHFQTFEYAIALPNMGSRAAANVVEKIQSAVLSLQFKSGISGSDLNMDFGIAGIPEHCKNMGQLIPAAAEARKRAESTSSNVMVFQS